MKNRKEMHEEYFYGTIGRRNPPIHVPPNERRLLFNAPLGENGSFSMSNDMLEKHLLCVGGPGSGKTNVINLILEQLRHNCDPRDVFVIFDTKGDYIQEFYKTGDYVIANGSMYKIYSGYQSWNIFEEIAASDDYIMAAQEISRSLFADRENTHQPFFTNAAKDIFAGILIHLYRNYLGQREWLNNKKLVELIRTSPPEWYLKELCDPRKNPDLVGITSYLGDGKNNQALGVLGELKSMVYDCFNGSFSEVGNFSIRKSVRSRSACAIFIEYDMAVGKSLTPLYRLLVDLALKETLGRTAQENGRVWYILDELKLLPHSVHLEDGLNLGRSLGCSVIAGVQSVNQLYELYGEFGGQVILGGFSNVFAFSTTDFQSREYLSKLFGSNVTTYRPLSFRQGDAVRERFGRVVEEWDLEALTKGWAYVGLIDKDPFLFHFERFTSHY